ncbi:MAG: hypothetical protein PHY24_07205 [Candidatus Cloacimonetes bacterium]|nr:hypothetical protein [Candidatus Cloacimonadota bacterium]MDD3533904.1 hypothetical protein [Candidatus Cloacimonadota bacterium]
MMRNWLLFWVFCLSIPVYAIDLPVYAKWQSLHSSYYDEAQTGKELSWDELYRAEFGIDSFRYKNTVFAMAVDTQQFFDESHLRLKSIHIGYVRDDWQFSANSREHGYGRGFGMDSHPILSRGFEQYHYQNMRLNSLELQYSKNRWQGSLKLGGNVHNQASAMMSLATFQPEDYRVEFFQEFRAMDNHWRTPVLISAINADYFPVPGKLWLYNTIAVSVLPEYDSTQAHQELYLESEVSYQAGQSSSISAAARYQSKEYAPKKLQFYQIRYRQNWQDFALIPLSELTIVQGERLWQHRLLGRYYLDPIKSIGLFYEYSHFDAQAPRHTVGLELDFAVDYASFTGL